MFIHFFFYSIGLDTKSIDKFLDEEEKNELKPK